MKQQLALLTLAGRYLDFSQQRLILICLSVVILAAGTTYLLVPAFRDYQESTRTNHVMAQQLASADIPDSELNKLETQIDQLKQQLQTTSIGQTPQQAEALLLAKLHQSTKDQNLQLLKVTPQVATDSGNIARLKFELEVAGSYQDTANWLEWLDAQANSAHLQRFEISKLDNARANNRANNHANNHTNNHTNSQQLLLTKVSILGYQWKAS